MKALTMRTLIAVTLAGEMSSVAWADNGNNENQCDSTTCTKLMSSKATIVIKPAAIIMMNAISLCLKNP